MRHVAAFWPLALALALMTSSGPAAASRVPLTVEMFAPARAVAAAVNTSRIAQLKGVFTKDARITADVPPHHWQGRTAGEDWLNAFDAALAGADAANVRVDLQPPAAGDGSATKVGYAAPAVLTYDVGRKHVVVQAQWSVVVVKRRAVWLIAEMTWKPLHRRESLTGK